MPRLATYNHRNPLRIESASTAAEIDARLLSIWETHPRRFIVPSSRDFLEKAARVIDILKAEMPECCGNPASGCWPAAGQLSGFEKSNRRLRG
jgi:hypothetical protein